MNDDELARRYAERGDDEAFRALVERHAGMVHGVAMRRTRDAELSEEITQTVINISR